MRKPYRHYVIYLEDTENVIQLLVDYLNDNHLQYITHEVVGDEVHLLAVNQGTTELRKTSGSIRSRLMN